MDIAQDREAVLDAGPWKRNVIVCMFGSFTTIVAMTLLLPFLPLYVEQLGVKDHAAIAQWSGVAYGATFFSAALAAPLWGRLADRYGRKLMLIRASLGMAVAMSLIGMAQNVWQLVALRLLAGLLGGYASGSTLLIATQTPKARSGWALGTLSSGIMAGSLAGPLIGGVLPPLIGIRSTFLLAGRGHLRGLPGTTFLIREEQPPPQKPAQRRAAAGRRSRTSGPIVAMLVTGHAADAREHVDRADHHRLCRAARRRPAPSRWSPASSCRRRRWAASCRPRASANSPTAWAMERDHRLPGGIRGAADPAGLRHRGWQLVALRFLMGLALGGLLPCIATSSATACPRRSPAACWAIRCRRNMPDRWSARSPAASSAGISACAPCSSAPPC